MKAIFYICLMLGALLLPATKGLRDGAVVLIQQIAAGIERLVIRGDYAEIREVDGDEFDSVVNDHDRLVVVSIEHDVLSAASEKSERTEIEKAMKRLPGKVLVAKVVAERNLPLLERLRISGIPTILIYSQGKMVRQFKGKVDKDEFLRVVTYHLEKPRESKGDSYIGPMKKDWLPPGVQTTSDDIDAPMTPLNTDE